MKSHPQINSKIKELNKLFDFKEVLSVKTDNKSVAKYYTINQIPYSIHSPNFVHMTIRKKGYSKEDGLLEHARIVERYINNQTKKVLELGVGRGGNSIYLASKHPEVDFTGIDLPNGQINLAFKKKNGIKNFNPQDGDFHDLSKFPKEAFDLVFIIEALCHSGNKSKVLKEVYRVLKKDGYFIVIDAFIGKEKLNPDELLAKQLLEKGMRVAKFEGYKDFTNLLKEQGLRLVYEEDDSQNIIASAKNFERVVKYLIKLPRFLSGIIIKVLPNEFTYNAISGYLMPDFLELGIAKYMVSVSQK